MSIADGAASAGAAAIAGDAAIFGGAGAIAGATIRNPGGFTALKANG
jgi:hypothetical protein